MEMQNPIEAGKREVNCRLHAPVNDLLMKSLKLTASTQALIVLLYDWCCMHLHGVVWQANNILWEDQEHEKVVRKESIYDIYKSQSKQILFQLSVDKSIPIFKSVSFYPYNSKKLLKMNRYSKQQMYKIEFMSPISQEYLTVQF